MLYFFTLIIKYVHRDCTVKNFFLVDPHVQCPKGWESTVSQDSQSSFLFFFVAHFYVKSSKFLCSTNPKMVQKEFSDSFHVSLCHKFEIQTTFDHLKFILSTVLSLGVGLTSSIFKFFILLFRQKLGDIRLEVPFYATYDKTNVSWVKYEYFVHFTLLQHLFKYCLQSN